MGHEPPGDPFAETRLSQAAGEPPASADPHAPTMAGDPRSRPRAQTGERPLPQAGDQVGRFVLERKLGEGGMGVVFGALDVELQRPVALKILRPTSGDHEGTEARARMLREAQAMAMVTHPNLVTIYEVGLYEGDVFLAMEYVTGRTLDRWLKDAHSIEDKLDVFAQAARALQAIHEAGLVHRDFKPANVMVTDDGQVRVLDLGIARRVPSGVATAQAAARTAEQDAARAEEILSSPHNSGVDAFESQLTQAGEIIGTPAYMAPEQLLGKEVGPAADQFSFSVSLFEGLAGLRPFSGSTQIETMANILAGEVRDWPEGTDVPAGLQAVVRRGLSRDPADRFESILEFLRAAEDGLGLRAQLRFLTTRWRDHDKNADYLLPEGERLEEGRALLASAPEVFSEEQADFVRRSAQVADKRRLVRRASIVAVALLLLGLIPVLWLLEQRGEQLDHATRSEVQAHLEAVEERVSHIFARNAEHIWILFEQRAAWLRWTEGLRSEASGEALDQALGDAVVDLNRYFAPVVRRIDTISSLMVASDDGVEYMIFDDEGGRDLQPPYQLYDRVVRNGDHPDLAFQVFWPVGEAAARDAAPRQGWLRPGDEDSRGQVWNGYDPTSRPWFRQAVAHATPTLTWTTPYLFFITKDAGITGSIAWTHGGRRHVLGVDFMLTDISRVTARLDTEDYQAVVTTKTGRVVGLPQDPRFESDRAVRQFFVDFDAARRREDSSERAADVEAKLPRMTELDIPVLARAFEAGQRTDADVYAFELEGETLWAGRQPAGGPAQQLVVYVVERP